MPEIKVRISDIIHQGIHVYDWVKWSAVCKQEIERILDFLDENPIRQDGGVDLSECVDEVEPKDVKEETEKLEWNEQMVDDAISEYETRKRLGEDVELDDILEEKHDVPDVDVGKEKRVPTTSSIHEPDEDWFSGGF